jgi:hypothetical protein
MKQSPRFSKTPVSLPGSVHERLNAYALAVTAAGIGITSIQQAEAKIVYTPVHKVLTHGSLSIPIDGSHFFTLFDLHGSSHQSFTSQGLIIYAKGGGVLGIKHSPAALRAGKVIGPADKFQSGAEAEMARVYCKDSIGTPGIYGAFANTTNRFLGFRFTLKGEVHYGWARFSSVSATGCKPAAISVTLTGYAYESTAGKSIVAGSTKGPEDVVGEPQAAMTPPTPKAASLGLLAMGSRGLFIWRREESIEATL